MRSIISWFVCLFVPCGGNNHRFSWKYNLGLIVMSLRIRLWELNSIQMQYECNLDTHQLHVILQGTLVEWAIFKGNNIMLTIGAVLLCEQETLSCESVALGSQEMGWASMTQDVKCQDFRQHRRKGYVLWGGIRTERARLAWSEGQSQKLCVLNMYRSKKRSLLIKGPTDNYQRGAH